MVTQPREKADAHQERAVPTTRPLTSGCLEALQAYIPTPWENVQPPSLSGAQNLSVLSDRAKPASGSMLTATKSHPHPA